MRLIAATNRQLKEAVDSGQFRADLYYRLNTFPIDVPALRERTGDIPLLAEHFVRKHSARLGKSIDAISTRMIRHLQAKSWPGNIRELEGFVERSLVSAAGSVLTLGKLDEVGLEVDRAGSPMDSASITNLRDVERQHILEVLNGCRWVIGGDDGAAALLGMPPSTLRSRMKKLGIERTSAVQ